MQKNILTLRRTLKDIADPARAEVSKKFFKTGKGQYGHGDRFLGITVPALRALSKQYLHFSSEEIAKLLDSAYHEERLVAVLILVAQYRDGDALARERIFRFYLKKADRINNWDLVDLSAYHIVGAHLQGKDHAILLKLAKSKLLWKRRIAMVATFYQICMGQAKPTLDVAQILFKDPEELMHKAAGWMLREVGKRVSKDIMEDFLCRHYHRMPRMMLRYAIEHLPSARRKAYLKAEI